MQPLMRSDVLARGLLARDYPPSLRCHPCCEDRAARSCHPKPSLRGLRFSVDVKPTALKVNLRLLELAQLLWPASLIQHQHGKVAQIFQSVGNVRALSGNLLRHQSID